MFFKPTSARRVIERGTAKEIWVQRDYIALTLAAIKFDSVLEISDDYVVCSPQSYKIRYDRGDVTKRGLLEPDLFIYRGNKLDRIFSNEFLDDPLFKDAFGIANFYRPEPSDESDSSASLSFSVALDDRSFDTLEQEMVSGVLPNEVYLGLISPTKFIKSPTKKKLESGWEPDGSRRIWNIPEGEKIDYLPIEEMRLEIELTSAASDSEEDTLDGILPSERPALSIGEIALEIKETNKQLVKFSKTQRNLVWLMAALVTISFFSIAFGQ